jgi:hypothetical protein
MGKAVLITTIIAALIGSMYLDIGDVRAELPIEDDEYPKRRWWAEKADICKEVIEKLTNHQVGDVLGCGFFACTYDLWHKGKKVNVVLKLTCDESEAVSVQTILRNIKSNKIRWRDLPALIRYRGVYTVAETHGSVGQDQDPASTSPMFVIFSDRARRWQNVANVDGARLGVPLAARLYLAIGPIDFLNKISVQRSGARFTAWCLNMYKNPEAVLVQKFEEAFDHSFEPEYGDKIHEVGTREWGHEQLYRLCRTLVTLADLDIFDLDIHNENLMLNREGNLVFTDLGGSTCVSNARVPIISVPSQGQ